MTEHEETQKSDDRTADRSPVRYDIGRISSHPFVSRRCEVPEEYVAEIRAQSVGVYSKKVPLLPIYISIEQFSAGRAYYTVHYFPFGTLGMSYGLTDGFCQENPLTGLQ